MKTRPQLNKYITIHDFKNFYWLKEELQTYCRQNGLSASGSKIDISNRIEIFLRSGEIQKPKRTTPKRNAQKDHVVLSLDTVISDNHCCSQMARAFFQSVIPNFHFSTYIQNYIKNNVGKTYNDVVEAWYEEESRKKDANYKNEIAHQFEYNQFIRDFYADPKNTGKARKEAIEAWKTIKSLPGSNKYNPKA